MIYDISRAVTHTTATFPGDHPYQATPLLALDGGASVNLVTLTTTPHIGTHADAPFHYISGGAHPASLSLTPYLGPARVVTVDRASGPITPADLPPDLDWSAAPRALIHTRYSALDDSVWDATFPYPDVTLIEHLAAHGVVLIGIDTPSFDAADSADLPGHHALARHGLVNLENLLLRDTPDGLYELIALPLKLDEACASPVRAVLRPLPSTATP